MLTVSYGSTQDYCSPFQVLLPSISKWNRGSEKLSKRLMITGLISAWASVQNQACLAPGFWILSIRSAVSLYWFCLKGCYSWLSQLLLVFRSWKAGTHSPFPVLPSVVKCDAYSALKRGKMHAVSLIRWQCEIRGSCAPCVPSPIPPDSIFRKEAQSSSLSTVGQVVSLVEQSTFRRWW